MRLLPRHNEGPARSMKSRMGSRSIRDKAAERACRSRWSHPQPVVLVVPGALPLHAPPQVRQRFRGDREHGSRPRTVVRLRVRLCRSECSQCLARHTLPESEPEALPSTEESMARRAGRRRWPSAWRTSLRITSEMYLVAARRLPCGWTDAACGSCAPPSWCSVVSLYLTMWPRRCGRTKCDKKYDKKHDTPPRVDSRCRLNGSSGASPCPDMTPRDPPGRCGGAPGEEEQ